jgi:DNA-directed RNA polymerase
MPNLIHSLDAASLTLLYEAFCNTVENNGNIINFYSVHDCYGVTAANIDTLITQLRMVYIKLYSKNRYLSLFEVDIISSILKAYSNKGNYFDENERILYLNDNKIRFPKFPCEVIDNDIKLAYEKLQKGE